MSNVTVLHPAVTADGYEPGDVVVDGDGVWRRRAPLPNQWLGFGDRYETHVDQLTQPLTLICRASEVTDLVRARQWAMRLEGQLAFATSFDLQAGEFPREIHVGIERRPEGWAVLLGGTGSRPVKVLHRDGTWEHERWADENRDDFPDAFRFTLDEAFERTHALLREAGE
jgi:hypothetical protein